MPAEVSSTPLQELCDPSRGITYGIVKVGDYVPGGIPVIRGGNIRDGRVVFDDEKRVTEAKSREFRRTILMGGEIIINLIAEPGHSAIVPPDLAGANVSRDVAVIALNDTVDHRYVDYVLKSPAAVQWLRSRLQGSVTQKINLGTLRELPIPTPPISQQRAIAHILGTLDDKIELNRRMIKTLEAMARALFKSWFVDFDPVRAKADGRWKPGQSLPGLPAHLNDHFPNRFVDSELGEIPEGWGVKTLKEVLVELETGGRPMGGVSKYSSGVPSIGAESIVGLGVFDYSKTKYVPREYFDSMQRGHIQSRDVLLYKDGGRPGMFEPHVSIFGDSFPFEECAINEHVYRMRAAEEFGQNLLFFWLSSDLVMEEMRIKGTGVAVPGLNSTQVKSLTTLVPDSRSAGAFSDLVDPIVKRILGTCVQSRNLAILRDTLLPNLISGAIRAHTTVGEAMAGVQ